MSNIRSAAIVIVAVALSTTSLAAPIEHRVHMVFGHDGFEPPHPILVGATLDLIYRFDSVAISPISDAAGGSSTDWATVWPTTNTTVAATIAGTAAHNGTFVGEMHGTTPTPWTFRNNVASLGDNDEIQFPRIQFAFNGDVVRILDVRARFGGLFDGLATIHPMPFPEAAALWDTSAKYVTAIPAHRSAMDNVSGFAVSVSEPQSMNVFAAGFLGIVAMIGRRATSIATA
jgi:hypothetical protein